MRRDRSVAGNGRLWGVALLELDGWDVAERLVESVVVEPADVFDDGELELAAAAPDAVGDQLGLDRVDEALGERGDAPMSRPIAGGRREGRR
jgi:hypothetical protein